MKICDYCGKENEDTIAFCVGCGTALSVPDETSPAPEKPRYPLNAGSATIIFLVYYVAQIFFAAVLAIIVASGIHSSSQQPITMEMFLATVLAGATMVYVSIAMIPEQLKDTSPNGAAWIPGRSADIAKTLVIGLVVGIFGHTVNKTMASHVAQHGLSTLDHILAGDPTQRIWFVGGVLLAPLPEELLFRGILYGGYQRYFGSVWATVITTALFVLLHLPQIIHYPANIVGITALALVAIWCRLHFKAIGPAVAMHFGYNAALNIFAFYKTWH
jgi:membrane protease YdiL (CAAX protease family)